MNFWSSTTLENSLVVSSHATTYDEGLCSWAFVPEQRKLTSIQKSAHKCHSSFIHHSSKWKQPRQLSMGERLNKVWCVPSVKCGSVTERTAVPHTVDGALSECKSQPLRPPAAHFPFHMWSTLQMTWRQRGQTSSCRAEGWRWWRRSQPGLQRNYRDHLWLPGFAVLHVYRHDHRRGLGEVHTEWTQYTWNLAHLPPENLTSSSEDLSRN